MSGSCMAALTLLALCCAGALVLPAAAAAAAAEEGGVRDAKFCKTKKLTCGPMKRDFFFAVSMFQIVNFPNDRCNGTDSKFGTCYTS